jgi:hypothetical protein
MPRLPKSGVEVRARGEKGTRNPASYPRDVHLICGRLIARDIVTKDTAEEGRNHNLAKCKQRRVSYERELRTSFVR